MKAHFKISDEMCYVSMAMKELFASNLLISSKVLKVGLAVDILNKICDYLCH